MEITVKDLTTALGLGSREQVAIVGGGGKTSLMFALAEERMLAGHRVLTTTTTKTWHQEAGRAPCLVLTRLDSAWHERVAAGLDEHGHVFLARHILDSGKVEGIDPLEADALYRERKADYLLLEADGAAGRPLKSPASHEPVIPSLTTVVIAIIGLEALGKSVEPAIVFRLEQFQAVTGLSPGMTVTPEALLELFLSSDGLFKGTPKSARRVAFLNKRDLLSDDKNARKLAGLLTRHPGSLLDRVVIGSIHHKAYSVVMNSAPSRVP